MFIEIANKKFWEMLDEMFPEAKGFNKSFDSNKGICIESKIKEGDEK